MRRCRRLLKLPNSPQPATGLSVYFRPFSPQCDRKVPMPRELELTEKLEILMSLDAEDREGTPETARPLPPRLRHAADE